MHDGVLRTRGLSRAERALVHRLEHTAVYSDADRVEVLRCFLADRYRLHPCLLAQHRAEWSQFLEEETGEVSWLRALCE